MGNAQSPTRPTEHHHAADGPVLYNEYRGEEKLEYIQGDANNLINRNKVYVHKRARQRHIEVA